MHLAARVGLVQYSAVPHMTDRRDGPSERGASAFTRIRLLSRVWWTALGVQVALHRRSLRDVASALAAPAAAERYPTALLSRAVSRGLNLGPLQPRCLVRSLVLYRLLWAQGDSAQLIIGLREHPASTDAHAWVELEGRDVGPAPGGRGYRELSRYPRGR